MADETQHQQDQQGGAQERPGAPEPAQAAQDQGQDRAGVQEPTERDEATETSDVQALRHEAASRRRALRTVEKERDQLRARVDASDRAEAERVAGARMVDPSDLWTMEGVALENFRDEDGVLVPELVAQSVSDVLAKKPHWKADRPGVNLHQGAREEIPEAGPSFGAALKGGRR